MDPVLLNMVALRGFFSRRVKPGIGTVRRAFMGIGLASFFSAKSPAVPPLLEIPSEDPEFVLWDTCGADLDVVPVLSGGLLFGGASSSDTAFVGGTREPP